MKKIGGGARKYGQNKEKCQRYKGADRKEENKIRK